MAITLRRRGGGGLDPWPGYVDALSTLLMVIIFVLLVFVLAQAFLSVALSGRDQALTRLTRQMAELSDMLSLERSRSAELRLSIAQLNQDLRSATGARDSLSRQLAALHAQDLLVAADRDSLRGQGDKLLAELADARLQAQSAAARNAQLQTELAAAAAGTDTAGRQTAAAASQLADTARQLEAAQARLKAMQDQMAALDQTVRADKATITARLSDLATLAQQVQALTALRDELERQAQDAAVRATTEQQRREAVQAELAGAQKLADSARAQIALLTQQVEQLRTQLGQVAAALGISEKAGRDKDAQIANLGQRLNTALAAKVEELERYRSEFFGRLREVLAGRPGIQIVGDRFVFQSEVLFPVGNADLSTAGQDQIRALATTLLQIAKEIPSELPWILRVDGHADRQPVNGGAYASNWELSAERAINVVKLLIAEGVPADRLAATAFGDTQPIANGDTPEAYAKNRRIELRLTSR